MKTLAICLLAAASTAWCQSKPSLKDTIWLGAALSLGMPRDTVMSALAQNYNLTRVADQDEWMVVSKTDAATVFGEVAFDKGKLTVVEREWTPADTSDFSFALALHGAFEQFEREGRQGCLVSTNTSRNPTMESRTITWFCGVKRLEITTIEIFSGTHKGKSTEIQELLRIEDAGH